MIAKKTANTHKRIDKVGEVLRQRRLENIFEQPTSSTERSTFEEFDLDADMDVDMEEEMTNDQQLEYLLVLYLVLFQAKHLSVEAGEELLAFLSFFVRALGHGLEIPTISTARALVNYSSASSGASRFLVCSLCRNICKQPPLQERPCGNSLFVGSSLKPVLEFPYNSIVETLKKFFVRPNFETEIEQWRGRYVEEGVLYDIYDGRVWNEMVDSAGEPFVNKRRSLMVSLNVDWFQPSDGMHYSCGGVYLTINNLPRGSRMKVSNIILVNMIPGPVEPTDDQLQNFLRPMIAELNTLYGGTMMPTYQNRNAARKVAEFMCQSAHKACNKCSTVFSRISTGANSTKPDFSDFDDEHWILRNNTQQRQEAYAWLNATHITQQRTLQTDTGSKWSELHRLE
ncbi:hypothetical protein G6F16_012628 [Rhizopus arrhizus]|nr:hypothetical protein G6F16_012628 [Rhizopus arrhizus]